MEKIGVGLYAIHKGWVGGHPPSVPPPLCLPAALVEADDPPTLFDIYLSATRRGVNLLHARRYLGPRDRRLGYAWDRFIEPIPCSRV